MDGRLIDLGVKDRQASHRSRNGTETGQSRSQPKADDAGRVIDDEGTLPQHIQADDGIDADREELLKEREVGGNDLKIGLFAPGQTQARAGLPLRPALCRPG